MSVLLRVLLILCVMSSCVKTGTDSGEDNASAADAGSVQTRREAVLVRGNYWISGVPGFGVNGFAALTGDYRLLFPREELAGNDQSGRETEFSVFLTDEPLFFSREWQAKPGIGNFQAYQRGGEEGFLVAILPEDSPWTVVILFPHGIPELAENAMNQFFRAWTSRLSYFISLAKHTSEISLPAAVEF